MRLAHSELENPLFLPDQKLGFLSIESPDLFYQLSKELISQVEEDDGSFRLTRDLKPLSMPKTVALVHSPLELDHNPRRAITALYKQLEKHTVDEALMHEIQSHLDQLGLCLRRMLPELDVELEAIEPPEWGSIFKFYDLKFKTNYRRLEEAILDYMRMARRYLKMEFFIFINTTPYLTKTALEDLCKQIGYEDFRVLFIESTLAVEKQPNNIRAVIVDEDLCEIIRYNKT